MSADVLREAAAQARAEASIARDMVPYMVEQYDDDNGCALEARRHDAIALLLDNEANLIDSVADHPDLHLALNSARVDLLSEIAHAYLGNAPPH